MGDEQTEWAEAMQLMASQARVRPIFDEASSLFGDRLTDSYFEGATAYLSVLDLTEGDRSAIRAAVRRLGIDETAVRVAASDPAALQAWAQLRHELDELHLAHPGIMLMSPSTRQPYCHPPFDIQFRADALATAERLHRSYGHWVTLRVGVLPFPPTANAEPYDGGEPTEPADPDELRVQLDGPLVIRSGETATHQVKVTNLSARPLEVHTNGEITARIVDPATGVTVGGYAGFQNLALVTFPVAPTETVQIPLLVGTASFSPDLGYAVPPGLWGVVAPLHLGDGRRVAGAPMEVVIIE